ncbi:isocitrate lyase [Moesziomyces antarcticus T-34]|uniref:Isocitrate lyase n=1 Tax=Pseudozyma antarctica (strain T-34) TaxID=1151754 RepID=M9M4I2_PSEA3|nr:isocitrate lyase [Moesziomyces antarcticus T-34]
MHHHHHHQQQLKQRKVQPNNTKRIVKRQSSSTIDNSANCLSGGLYVAPASGAQVQVTNVTEIKWDQSCLDASVSKIDIYVYSPSMPDQFLPIHVMTGIPKSAQLYNTKLDPRWWGRDLAHNSSVPVSFNIVPAGNEPWDSSNPMGPTFVANYNVPDQGGESKAATYFGKLTNSVKTAFLENGHLTPAGKTAAIVCPLVVLGVALGLLVRRLHIKRHNKTMDDITPAFATDDEMREARPRGMSIYDEGNRTSRISFADNTRGDRISRISYANSSDAHGRSSSHLPRVGQQGNMRRSQLVDSYYDPDAPAVPQLDARYRASEDVRRSRFSDGLIYAEADELRNPQHEDDDEVLMSPTQNEGPRPLGANDVDRMRQSLDANARNSMLSYPALSMMQSGREGSDGHDMFDGPNAARRVSGGSADSYIDHMHYQHSGNGAAVAHLERTGAGVSAQTGMAPPSNFASPDEAMKHYASLRAGSSAVETSAQSSRSLYTPDAANHRGHSSVAGSSLNEEEVVGYNEMIDHGNQSR